MRTVAIPASTPKNSERDPGRDEPGRKGTGTEEPPVSCQEARFPVCFVNLPVNVIVQHHPGLEPEETDQGDLDKHRTTRTRHRSWSPAGTRSRRAAARQRKTAALTDRYKPAGSHSSRNGSLSLLFHLFTGRDGIQNLLYHLSRPREQDGFIYYPAGTSRRYRRNF